MRSVICKSENSYLVEKILTNEKDMENYLDILYQIGNRYIIIATVIGILGKHVPGNIVKGIRKLGFTDFNRQTYRIYAGVSVNGTVVCNQKSEIVVYDANQKKLVDSIKYNPNLKGHVLVHKRINN